MSGDKPWMPRTADEVIAFHNDVLEQERKFLRGDPISKNKNEINMSKLEKLGLAVRSALKKIRSGQSIFAASELERASNILLTIHAKDEAYKRATLAWLRLENATDGIDQGEAERALRDLFFALGAATCAETENGDGTVTLTFAGLGRQPGRKVRIKLEVLL